MNIEWKSSDYNDRQTDKPVLTTTRFVSSFGSNSVMRSLPEVYAEEDNKQKYVLSFVAAWVTVMNADRFDLKKNKDLMYHNA